MTVEHTFDTEAGLVTKTITKAKAIRGHCLSCCVWQKAEVLKCTIYTCVLYPFRFGKEDGLKRKYIPEEHEDEEEDLQDLQDAEEILAEDEEWADLVSVEEE